MEYYTLDIGRFTSFERRMMRNTAAKAVADGRFLLHDPPETHARGEIVKYA